MFSYLAKQLASAKLPLDDELHALFLLSSLPGSWETLIVSLKNYCQENKLSLEVVKMGLLNQETRIKEIGASSQSKANVAQAPSRGQIKQRGSQNRDKSKARSKFKGKLHDSIVEN